MFTIWFNRTYATAAHLFPRLRANPDGLRVQIIASHVDSTSPVLGAADRSWLEPELPARDYVEWALQTCAERSVDVFVPRLHLLAIAEARPRFEAAGVAIVAGPPAAIRLLSDKSLAYADAEAAGLRVPPFRVVRTASELETAVAELSAEGQLCIKPVSGVGGVGYRQIVDRSPSWEDVMGPAPADITLADLVAAIGAEGVVPATMVMPFLPGPEVSVDCLGDADGQLVAAVARSKNGRQRELVDDPAAVEMARSIVSRHKVRALSNTQVRYWQRPGFDTAPQPYLLETNVRAAGGLFQLALTGADLMWSAIREAQGLAPEVGPVVLGALYTTLPSLAPIHSN